MKQKLIVILVLVLLTQASSAQQTSEANSEIVFYKYLLTKKLYY